MGLLNKVASIIASKKELGWFDAISIGPLLCKMAFLLTASHLQYIQSANFAGIFSNENSKDYFLGKININTKGE